MLPPASLSASTLCLFDCLETRISPESWFTFVSGRGRVYNTGFECKRFSMFPCLASYYFGTRMLLEMLRFSCGPFCRYAFSNVLHAKCLADDLSYLSIFSVI